MKVFIKVYPYKYMYFHIKHNKYTSNDILAKRLNTSVDKIENIRIDIVNKKLESEPPTKPKFNNNIPLKESELLYKIPTFDEIKLEYNL